MSEIIDLYKHHGTPKQFRTEIKTDLDLGRFPRVHTNDAIVHLASLTYN